jgi:hypothetical protein
MKDPRKIEYLNKKGKLSMVWPWTLDKKSTLYVNDHAKYVPASKLRK